MNPRWSKDYVRRRLKWIDKEMSEDQMDAVSKGYDFNLIPSELKFTREEAQDVYECLKGDSQRMFRYTGWCSPTPPPAKSWTSRRCT